MTMTICHNKNYYFIYRIACSDVNASTPRPTTSLKRFNLAQRERERAKERTSQPSARLPACITCVPRHALHSIRCHCFIHACGSCVHTRISTIDSAHKTKTPCTLNYIGAIFSFLLAFDSECVRWHICVE